MCVCVCVCCFIHRIDNLHKQLQNLRNVRILCVCVGFKGMQQFKVRTSLRLKL